MLRLGGEFFGLRKVEWSDKEDSTPTRGGANRLRRLMDYRVGCVSIMGAVRRQCKSKLLNQERSSIREAVQYTKRQNPSNLIRRPWRHSQ